MPCWPVLTHAYQWGGAQVAVGHSGGYTCREYCSPSGYCGNSGPYRGGIDCTEAEPAPDSATKASIHNSDGDATKSSIHNSGGAATRTRTGDGALPNPAKRPRRKMSKSKLLARRHALLYPAPESVVHTGYNSVRSIHQADLGRSNQQARPDTPGGQPSTCCKIKMAQQAASSICICIPHVFRSQRPQRPQRPQRAASFEDLRCVFLSHLGSRVPTAPTKTRLEFGFCKQRNVNPVITYLLFHN